MTESKWIIFDKVADTGKTSIYEVRTKDGYTLLGRVKWFGRWRKYSFFPMPETVYETTCLTDIVTFINELMQQRKVNG
jgi:hypothetical protein